MKKIFIATGNRGKLKEILDILKDVEAEFLSKEQFPNIEEIEEDGYSYIENALIKAGYCVHKTGLPVLAEDSGIEVEALGGLPGILSARYAGFNASDAQRIKKLLDELKNVPQEKRRARYVCSAVFATPDGGRWTAEGTVSGIILEEPRGTGGFGYDPVFYLPELGKTMAELPLEVKNRISHRGKAFLQLKEKIIQWLKS